MSETNVDQLFEAFVAVSSEKVPDSITRRRAKRLRSQLRDRGHYVEVDRSDANAPVFHLFPDADCTGRPIRSLNAQRNQPKSVELLWYGLQSID